MIHQNPKNPFTVRTPEGLAAVEATKLFVNVFTDFYKIRDPGHSMLNGPRGSGKSMMFRYLEPDCQCIAEGKQLRDIDFFAVLVSIKNTDVNVTELRRLSDKHFNVILNEHFLTTYIASKLFDYISRLDVDPTNEYLTTTHEFVTGVLVHRLLRCGMSAEDMPVFEATTTSGLLKEVGELFDILYCSVGQYVKRLSFPGNEATTFSGPLCGYLDLLHPVLKEFRKLPFMPNGPVYLLLDDADVLSDVQTRVLNSWVGTRTSSDVSIKISTQLRYKTFAKVSGGAIETPHDYSEVNIVDLYTTNRGKYLKRVHQIVEKRLALANIQATPEEFFPEFKEQEDRVNAIKDEIREGKHEVSGRGYRLSDDVVRYARPIYMASLAGTKKSTSKYMYAGFAEMVHISSGLIRYFLEPASLMFSEQHAKSETDVTHIVHGVQNDELRKMSKYLMTSEFDKITLEEDNIEDPDEEMLSQFANQKQQLRNLIEALGGTFYRKLLSEDAERRVFSVAFTDGPQSDVVEIFELGLKHGYFQKSTIGNKDGTGRTPLYILTRRLAPNFNLDPSGFAGYLFVSSERLREAIHKPATLLRRVKRRGVTEAFGEERQLRLFMEEGF